MVFIAFDESSHSETSVMQLLSLIVGFPQNFANILVERTQQLKLEKNKSDRLLRQMLPTSVIQQLKQQRQVSCAMIFRFEVSLRL